MTRSDWQIIAVLIGAVLIGVLLGNAFTSTPAEPAGKPKPWMGAVTRVVDGDTLDIQRPVGGVVRIRLAGIDAPEKRQPCGPEASAYLASQASKGTAVEVKPLGTATYGRMVAWVHLASRNEENLSVLLASEGYAWRLPGYPCYPFCGAIERAQVRAKQRRLGCWQDHSDIEMPWDYRARLRKKSDAYQE